MAAMRVIRAHLNQRSISITVVRDEILRTAEHLADGAGGLDAEVLAARLEKAAGCAIAELARHAAGWPEPRRGASRNTSMPQGLRT